MNASMSPSEQWSSQGESQKVIDAAREQGVRYLSSQSVNEFLEIALAAAAKKGAEFYGWKNAPTYKNGGFSHSSGWGESTKTSEVSPQRALDIYQEKLDGAYGERFLLMAAAIPGLVSNGHKVAFLQLQKEEGVPFDATGWIVISVNGYPLFHIAPTDLPMAEMNEKGLVNLIVEGSAEAKEHEWKGTNKVQEFEKLLSWAIPRKV